MAKYEIRVKTEETAFNQGHKHFVFHLQNISERDIDIHLQQHQKKK